MLRSHSCHAILQWLFILLLSYSFTNLSIITTTSANYESDQLALLAIKSQLHDPVGVMSSWNNSIPLCQWTGVLCGRRHQRVTGLDLRNQNIEGPLSPFIGNLSFLRSIDLHDNNFYGEIPIEIGHLFRLQYLRLSNNSFTGTIPITLSNCSNLVRFAAINNNLEGEIPVELNNLLKLEILSIGGNHLTGQLSASIGNLSSLQVLHLAWNNLGGKIPETLGQLRSLTFFNIAINNFFGIVPPSIFNISTLDTLILAFNRFHGTLPPNIGSNFPNLKLFSIASNNFTGSLPSSISNASNLVDFSVPSNRFSGKVSIDFSHLKNLAWLNLGDNNLGNGVANDLEFISSLTNCTKLEKLGLYVNQFGGELPHAIANLSTTLNTLEIGFNQITGDIYPGIQNLVKLSSLSLRFNQFTGNIPHVIGDLKDLQSLELSENNLQGSIPTSIGNLTKLGSLLLGSNNLQGNIPSSLGNCQNLLLLTLNKNKLTGTVPREILGIITLSLGLDLSDNLLSGPFPLEAGKLDNLVSLNISGNRFSSEIPETLSGCTSLQYLYLQGNSFIGSIPPLESLRSIIKLDFSSNNLSGQIPEYLEKLSFSEYLNLSYNHFEGKVPTKGVFSNLTGISLVGNEMLCGGLAELHLPSCHDSKGSKRSKIIPKVVVPVVVFLILSLCFIIILTWRRKSANKTSRIWRMGEPFPMISYAELSKATNEFSSSNMVGQGRYGFVYKGLLDEIGLLVAVKVINLQQKGASKSFMVECEALKNIRHRNLIKIVTICSSIDFKGDDFKALVYEYMQNGSLEEWLHWNEDELETSNLSLDKRLNIAIDVAFAIEYLHHHYQPPIVHGDLKPSNVLLDHDMVAHVGDFGLAKFLYDHPIGTAPRTHLSSSIAIKGTVGYVAPEYGMGSEMSISGDVYSFGILLLELFTGRRLTNSMFNNGLTLHDFAKMAFPERVIEIVESSLLLEVGVDDNNVENFARRRQGEERVRIEDCLVDVMRIGVVCSMRSPAERMEMKDVVKNLCAVRDNFLKRTRDVGSSQL